MSTEDTIIELTDRFVRGTVTTVASWEDLHQTDEAKGIQLHEPHVQRSEDDYDGRTFTVFEGYCTLCTGICTGHFV